MDANRHPPEPVPCCCVLVRRVPYLGMGYAVSSPGEVEAVLAREVVLRVDFELLDDDGCSWISMRFHRRSAAGPPRPRDLVYLLDRNGAGCVGRVQQVEGWYVCVRPDWTTWTGSELPPAASAAAKFR